MRGTRGAVAVAAAVKGGVSLRGSASRHEAAYGLAVAPAGAVTATGASNYSRDAAEMLTARFPG